MSKDVTVSKLSQLQKRVLVYARQQMLAKDQKITPSEDTVIHVPAPPWLDDVLTATLSRIFELRKHPFGKLDVIEREGEHEWIWFFEEIRFAKKAIEQAAKQAKCTEQNIDLMRLFRLALPKLAWITLKANDLIFSVHPWPYYNQGWEFLITLEKRNGERITKNEVMKILVDNLGEDELKKCGLWLDDNPNIPINCTVPEMLRDLFGFELAKGGHVAALAFDVQAIGKARYNNAQASLRRACARLYARRLIGTQRGQSHGLHWTIYERSGIGLTEAGVAAAAAAIENKPPDEVPLPEPVAAKVAPARRNKVRS